MEANLWLVAWRKIDGELLAGETPWRQFSIMREAKHYAGLIVWCIISQEYAQLFR